MIRFSILVSENPPFTVCGGEGGKVSLGSCWTSSCDRGPVQSIPQGHSRSQQEPSLLAPSDSSSFGFGTSDCRSCLAVTTSPTTKLFPPGHPSPDQMLSLTLVGDPPTFLPGYTQDTQFVSLTVLGLSALCRPFVWDLALLDLQGARAVFCSSLYPLLPHSPVQPDRGR